MIEVSEVQEHEEFMDSETYEPIRDRRGKSIEEGSVWEPMWFLQSLNNRQWQRKSD